MLAMMVGLALSSAPFAQLVLAADAPSVAIDIIRTKDGKVHAGKILSETQRGYLFRDESGETHVIEFETIDDVGRGGDRPTPSPSSATPSEPPAPPAPPVLVPQMSALEMANHVARMAELKTEIRDLRERLDDATLAGPIVKLIGATALTFLTFALLNSWSAAQRCEALNLSYCGNTTALASGASLATFATVGLWIWGSIQLHLRVRDLRFLPDEIRTREEQLQILSGPATAPLAPAPIRGPPSTRSGTPSPTPAPLPPLGTCSGETVLEMRREGVSESAIAGACNAKL